MALDEKELRRPGFDESQCVPVDFPGGTFYLPRPILYLCPVFRDGRRIDEARLCTDDPEFDRLKDIVSATATDEDADFGGAVTDIAVHMLRNAYDLADDQIGRIFRVRVDGAETSMAWMTEVMAVAHGRGEKKSPDG